MGREEGTSDGDGTVEGVQCSKSGEMNNGFVIGMGNDGGGDRSLGAVEGFRTYKRRKHTKSSSESKVQENGGGSMEAASKLEDQTSKEPLDRPPVNCPLNGSKDVSHRQWRMFVLERMYQSLSDDEGGVRGCIQDALTMTVKESDICDEDRCKISSQTGWMPNGIHHAAKEHVGVISSEALNPSCHHTVTGRCRNVFLSIILSEKFTTLCKLLFENFQEMKADNIFSLSLINRRMKEGAYECSPTLFSADIQQLWTKLQGIGTELISLAKSLSETSRTSYNEQFYIRDRVCMCRHCGDQADWRDCLVCDSCEDMYHGSCVKPGVKVVTQKNWFCAQCTASGIKSPHENCVVCQRLNPGYFAIQADNAKTNQQAVNEFGNTSNYVMDDGVQLPEGKYCFCKTCGSRVENGENLKMCDHSSCPNKYYHVRCLTTKQLKSYGPRWYCPSCLCRVCLTDKDDDKICLCDGCDHAYHIYCMDPPHTSIPKGKWFCQKCYVKIQEIRWIRKHYERRANRLRRKKREERRQREKEEMAHYEMMREKEREKMNMLLDAALNYDAASQVKS